ncbi:hypothetical protein TWF106_004105 [Orbilia oligospora]|uniref:Cytochrome P450 n=1 Tax=Orbilia oligospora TaxID=2813651 RepID=A0A6G1M1H4_ORBOL|nr:hypothetical protein TWF106_004105 [Orbilia oligospora]KAF3210183.1 hypothetical protein TWF679_006932 [Orbilia oligospora]KAF3230258.1 hypothetical protein TWF191_010955 [Orbilia oligospora]KAF3241982.1 hypothetical protein TWF192_008756 [Orbilia oligospora]
MLSVEDIKTGGPILYGGALLTAILAVRQIVASQQKKLPLPPGPKGSAIVGNINDLPPPGPPEWQHWLKHKDLYGPISSITVLGQTIILIHDLDIAEELLVRRQSNYSSRPHLFFAGEMCGMGHIVTFQDYNKNFKQQRKLAAWQIGSNTAIRKLHPLIHTHVQRFLFRTLSNPDKYVANLHATSSSIVLDTLYGYKPNLNGFDPLINLVDRMMSAFSEATAAGAWIVDNIPWLRHFPEWLPGMEFKGIARTYNKTVTDTTNVPFEFVVLQRKRSENRPSYVSGLLDRHEKKVLNEKDRAEEWKLIKDSAISLYGGGSDTTVAALAFFFRTMMFHPEVQRKAQEEIDRVIGNDRLPGFNDRVDLPYVEAVFKESLRFNPIVPAGFPHTVDTEDEYAGYRIPKGAIIVPSIHWFSRDPKTYTDPETFNPERFLKEKPELNPKKFVFGFGRRICPGQQLADASTFLTIAQTLAVFDIKKPVDPVTGLEIEPEMGATSGTVSHPHPFQCCFVPRNEKCRELISRVEKDIIAEGDGDAKVIDELVH